MQKTATQDIEQWDQPEDNSILLGHLLYDLMLVGKWLEEYSVRFALHDILVSRQLSELLVRVKAQYRSVEKLSGRLQGVITPLLDLEGRQLKSLEQGEREKSFYVLDSDTGMRLFDRLRHVMDRICEHMRFLVLRLSHRATVGSIMGVYATQEHVFHEIDRLLTEYGLKHSPAQVPTMLPLPDSFGSLWLSKC